MASNARTQLSRISKRLRIQRPLVREGLGEFVGTFIMVLLGNGCIAQAVFGGKDHHHDYSGFVLITLGWGFAVMMGVFFSMRTGRGIINPAVSTAFCLLGHITVAQLVVFVICQVLGAFFSSAVLYSVYYERLMTYAKDLRDLNLTDGRLLTVDTTGGIFTTWPSVSAGGAFYDQVIGTALLCGGALAIIDSTKVGVPVWAHPPIIGLLVSGIVGSFALNAGAPLNPARDLGPRLFIAIAGWGVEAFTAHNYYFWVPIFGPTVGAVVGAIFYQLCIALHIEKDEEREDSRSLIPGDDRDLVAPEEA